jgi:hypothetical protein
MGMRGEDASTASLFSYVSCEARVPGDHPLRPARAIVDEVLEVLSAAFAALCAKTGRPSIPPEKLLRALLLQAFYSVHSERQLMEQLDYNRCSADLSGWRWDAPVWDVTVFTKNRERLFGGRCRRPVHECGAAPAAGQGAVVGRTFLGRRHADRSLGEHQELSSEGR